MLFRALRDFNIPKILSQDMVIFTGLLQDLFPGVDPPRKRDMEFEKVCVMLHILCHTRLPMACPLSFLSLAGNFACSSSPTLCMTNLARLTQNAA